MNKEERADREEAEGKYKEFDNVRDLTADLKRPGAVWPCNNPSCTTCLCGCPLKGIIAYSV